MSRRTHAPSRRDVAGALGAMLLLTAAEAGPAKAAELDGPLLAAFRRWTPLERERMTVVALYEAAGDGSTYEADARFDAMTGPWHDAVDDIMSVQARTPEGVTAKAQVLRALLENHVGFGGPHETHAQTTEEFAWSLVNDMLGRASA